MPTTAFLAGYYGLRQDASEAFVQGYLDEMTRLDAKGEGTPCGRGWISPSKKCSKEKRKGVDKANARKFADLKRKSKGLKSVGEVNKKNKVSKGQKARGSKSSKRKTVKPSVMEARRKLAGTTGEPTKATVKEYQRIRGEYESILKDVSRLRRSAGTADMANELIDKANAALKNEIDKLRKNGVNLPDRAINDLYGDPEWS